MKRGHFGTAKKAALSADANDFVVIPGGVPHFAAAKDGAVIVQLSGTSKFGTENLEKGFVSQ